MLFSQLMFAIVIKKEIAFYSKADHPRMRAFSYTWSLPVTWFWPWPDDLHTNV